MNVIDYEEVEGLYQSTLKSTQDAADVFEKPADKMVAGPKQSSMLSKKGNAQLDLQQITKKQSTDVASLNGGVA